MVALTSFSKLFVALFLALALECNGTKAESVVKLLKSILDSLQNIEQGVAKMSDPPHGEDEVLPRAWEESEYELSPVKSVYVPASRPTDTYSERDTLQGIKVIKVFPVPKEDITDVTTRMSDHAVRKDRSRIPNLRSFELTERSNRVEAPATSNSRIQDSTPLQQQQQQQQQQRYARTGKPEMGEDERKQIIERLKNAWILKEIYGN